MVIGADCAPVGSTGTTADGSTAYCSTLQTTGASIWSLTQGDIPSPTVTTEPTDEPLPVAEESPVRVCMQQTGQTRRECRRDIRREQRSAAAAMKFAVIAPVAAGVTADPAWMAAFARHVEACGFESIVVVEHTVLMSEYSSIYPYDASGRVELPADCPVPDPLDLLAFLAGHTDRLGLATGVLVLPNHHPVVLAKRVATLDVLSGGRFRLCVGMGWLKEEIEACGAEFSSRGRRADEQLEVMRLLFADRPGGASFHGEFFGFDNAMCYPKPVSRVPIHIGGHSTRCRTSRRPTR